METNADELQKSAGKKRGRKAIVRECEASGESQERWCGPCKNGGRKKPCKGLRLEPQFEVIADAQVLTTASTRISTADETRPSRAIQPPTKFEFPEKQVRDRRVSSEVAARRENGSAMPKLSALQQALAAQQDRYLILEAKLVKYTKELAAEQQRADKLSRDAIKRDMHKRQKTLSICWTPAVERATTSNATSSFDASEAVGYTRTELGRTFRRDVEKIQTMILEVAGDDPLRQLQLADGAWKRFVAMKDKLLGDEHEAGRVVLSSLRDFFRTLRNRYQADYPI